VTWIWINNRQNSRWSITSVSVPRCLWHEVQLRLERWGTFCVHCRLGHHIPLWDGSYKGVLVLLSIGWYVTEHVVMLAAGSCICSCKDVIHWKKSVNLISCLLSSTMINKTKFLNAVSRGSTVGRLLCATTRPTVWSLTLTLTLTILNRRSDCQWLSVRCVVAPSRCPTFGPGRPTVWYISNFQSPDIDT